MRQEPVYYKSGIPLMPMCAVHVFDWIVVADSLGIGAMKPDQRGELRLARASSNAMPR